MDLKSILILMILYSEIHSFQTKRFNQDNEILNNMNHDFKFKKKNKDFHICEH